MIHKKLTDRVCIIAINVAVVLSLALIIVAVLCNKEEQPVDKSEYISTDYVEKIFDDTYVHTIDIQLPQVNWDYLVAKAEKEQYVVCNLLIDGELFEDVAIRPKGNSSLKAIKTMDSDRFSFKIEFDHYKADSTYYGLDKLALNNLGQDVSCMKDYITYHMMNEIGIAAPLSSYVQVKLNGEDFGLYLAVEAIEDSFAYRNYGTEYGNIYKPECFEISKVTPKAFMNTNYNPLETDFSSLGPGDRADILGTFAREPFETAFGEDMEVAAFNYVGDDLKRYKVFYDSAVFDITKTDKIALISAIKQLNSTENAAEAVDMESLIKYFVVHNFVNNYDGYSGIFVHNYYVREYNGKLSLIPWDYNLAFGIFTVDSALKSFLGEDSPYYGKLEVGEAMSDAKGMINYPIDTPTITVDLEDRPLMAVIFENEEYLELYHQYFAKFLDEYFTGGKFDEMFNNARNLIAPYVSKGQTFYTVEQFEKAADSIYKYSVLREESIRGQLEGTIPATMEGQSADYSNLIDDEGLDLSASVTFESLVMGIKSADIVEVLDAIAGDYEHNSEGVTKALEEIQADSSKLGSMFMRILTGSSLIKNAIKSAVKGPALLLLSIIVFIISLKKVKKYQRRKRPKGGSANAVQT